MTSLMNTYGRQPVTFVSGQGAWLTDTEGKRYLDAVNRALLDRVQRGGETFVSNAVVGGRYMATGTVEYVHWLNDTWGAAAFVDVGDASDSSADWKANQSYGIGARFKTPAGPFALDLAYAEGPRKFRLAFSVTVAF